MDEVRWVVDHVASEAARTMAHARGRIADDATQNDDGSWPVTLPNGGVINKTFAETVYPGNSVLLNQVDNQWEGQGPSAYL